MSSTPIPLHSPQMTIKQYGHHHCQLSWILIKGREGYLESSQNQTAITSVRMQQGEISYVNPEPACEVAAGLLKEPACEVATGVLKERGCPPDQRDGFYQFCLARLHQTDPQNGSWPHFERSPRRNPWLCCLHSQAICQITCSQSVDSFLHKVQVFIC